MTLTYVPQVVALIQGGGISTGSASRGGSAASRGSPSGGIASPTWSKGSDVAGRAGLLGTSGGDSFGSRDRDLAGRARAPSTGYAAAAGGRERSSSRAALSDKESLRAELEELLNRAVAEGVTDTHGRDAVYRNLAKGRFNEQYYIDMYTAKISEGPPRRAGVESPPAAPRAPPRRAGGVDSDYADAPYSASRLRSVESAAPSSSSRMTKAQMLQSFRDEACTLMCTYPETPELWHACQAHTQLN